MDGMTGLRSRSGGHEDASRLGHRFAFENVIDEICRLAWETIDASEVLQVAKVYYYFSIQFRENLEIACRLCPHDDKLQKLRQGECDTDNLSPWPGVAALGEKLDHDEFVRRSLALQTVDREADLTLLGEEYLAQIRKLDEIARATSIASYEDGGLSRVFLAMLRARHWRGNGARSFKFFLEEHIRFDSDDGGGHGGLSRHLRPDDTILPLWLAFKHMLVAAVPKLSQTAEDRVRALPVPAEQPVRSTALG
jgi:hypothetical protein